jgi:TRAP-type C4-dicarboxylate transport system permease small subunit
MLYALAAAVVWGVPCGLGRAPFWVVMIGGVAAAGLAVWLEWDALVGRAPNRRRNFWLLIVASFVFLAMMGVGIVSLGYFLGEWLQFQLRRL